MNPNDIPDQDLDFDLPDWDEEEETEEAPAPKPYSAEDIVNGRKAEGGESIPPPPMKTGGAIVLKTQGAPKPKKAKKAKPAPAEAVPAKAPAPPVREEEEPIAEALSGGLQACREDAKEKQEEEDGSFVFKSAEELGDEPFPPYDCVVEGAFEMGTKAEVVAPSKCGKSFFVIGLGLHVAMGRDFLGLKVPKPRRVLYINLELRDQSMTRRLHKLREKYGIERLPKNFLIWNARGKGELVRKSLLRASVGFDLVIIDPRYKLILSTEDENSGTDAKIMNDLFDQVANTGAAVLIVHHDAKGNAGDRSARDRGAGSGVTARDADFRFTLTPHEQGEGLVILEGGLARDFPPIEPRTLRFDGGAFSEEDGIIPIPETTASIIKARRQEQAQAEKTETEDQARRAVLHFLEERAHPQKKTVLKDVIQHQTSLGEKRARGILSGLVLSGELVAFPAGGQGGGEWIGYPSMFDEDGQPIPVKAGKMEPPPAPAFFSGTGVELEG